MNPLLKKQIRVIMLDDLPCMYKYVNLMYYG